MADKFPPVKVNLVEEDGWSRWDPGGELPNWASDNAYSEYSVVGENDCKDLINDLMAASFPKAQWRKIGDEELERICSQLKEDWQEGLELTHNAIIDAMTWAWEEAYTPSDDDVKDVISKMADGFEVDEFDLSGAHWQRVIGRQPRPGVKEWIPGAKKWSYASAFKSLLQKVGYERKPGWYDRHLVFDFGDAEIVGDVLEAARKEGAEEEAEEALANEFEKLQNEYLWEFFRKLDREMDDADPGNRVDFRKFWKVMLSDKQAMKAVGKEIKEFLKGDPREWSPRQGR